MASSSNFVLAAPLALTITEKLTRTNYNLWKAQVFPAIRGGGEAQLEGLLDGSDKAPAKELAVTDATGTVTKLPNKEYAKWIARDQ